MQQLKKEEGGWWIIENELLGTKKDEKQVVMTW